MIIAVMSKERSWLTNMSESSFQWDEKILDKFHSAANLYHICVNELSDSYSKNVIEYSNFEFSYTIYKAISSMKLLVNVS